eukprot:352386-Chlamydomonas_euryale.AAC.2
MDTSRMQAWVWQARRRGRRIARLRCRPHMHAAHTLHAPARPPAVACARALASPAGTRRPVAQGGSAAPARGRNVAHGS